MDEKKQKLNKVMLAGRILRRFALGLLSILLVLALVYQTPWKVTILLAAVLAAYAILPGPARKRLWLCVSVVLIVLVVWILLPDGDDVWVPFTLTQELAAYEARYALPENQNAAVVYNKLLEDFVPNQWRLRFLRKEEYSKTLSEPWFSRDHPALSQWLDKHNKTIMALPEACRIRTCRFPGDFRMSSSDELHTYRYSALKSWALIHTLSGNNDMAEGREDEAFLKYIYALQIAEHLYQQKRVHDFLIGFGIEGFVLPQINRFIIEGNIREEQLQLVTQILGNPEDNWSQDFSQCFEYDKLLVKNTFCSLVYQTNAQGRIRLSRDPAAAIRLRLGANTPSDTYWQKKSMKTYTIAAWFFFPATPRKASEMIDTIFEKYRPMAEPDFAWDKKDGAPAGFHSLNCYSLVWSLVNRASLQYGGFHDIYPKRLSQRRGTRILIALKQYHIKNGLWPDNLDAIKSAAPPEAFIDPVTKNPLKYENHGERFSLYGDTENIWPK